MASYYVNTNAQPNGDHEVHRDGCGVMPAAANRKYLGEFANCYPAVAEARRIFYKANGCFYCSQECHTS